MPQTKPKLTEMKEQEVFGEPEPEIQEEVIEEETEEASPKSRALEIVDELEQEELIDPQDAEILRAAML